MTQENMAEEQSKSIAFIGGGNMATSIISGLISDGYPASKITVSAPSEQTRDRVAAEYGVNTTANNMVAAADADVIVLAIKPQILKQVCEQLMLELGGHGDKLYVSIAAGVTWQSTSDYLNHCERVVRTMPNTPSKLGLGMTGLYAPQSLSLQDRQFSEHLMQAVGKIVWVEQESGINSVIAAAGSAPAYFFLFMEAIEREALNMGFTSEQARLLVEQTALGSAQMVVDSDLPLSELRAQVTSKGGTTAEAVRTLQEGQMPELVAKAMRAAVTRAEQMASLF